jgi:hypothetical protein
VHVRVPKKSLFWWRYSFLSTLILNCFFLTLVLIFYFDFDFILFFSGWKVDLGLITDFYVCINKLCLFVFHVRVICFCFLTLFRAVGDCIFCSLTLIVGFRATVDEFHWCRTSLIYNRTSSETIWCFLIFFQFFIFIFN